MKKVHCAVKALALLTQTSTNEIQELLGADPRTLGFETEEQFQIAQQLVDGKQVDEVCEDSSLMSELKKLSPIAFGVDIYQVAHVMWQLNIPSYLCCTVEGSPFTNEASLRHYPTSEDIKKNLFENRVRAFIGIRIADKINHAVYWHDDHIIDPDNVVKEFTDQIVILNAVVRGTHSDEIAQVH